MDKRSILEVIGQRVELSKTGREYKGLCPLHSEKTPSFAVNPDKEVFYCHGCHVGGDAIRFVELSEPTDFRGALKILGIDGSGYKPKPRDILKERRAAMVANWMNQQHAAVGAMLRKLTEDIDIATDADATTLVEQWEREFSILETLFEDLQQPEYAGELYAAREAIEAITRYAPTERLMEFPPCTPDYVEYLTAYLPEAGCPCCR